MLSLLAPILVIGVLVFFHELGHFWVAKRSGIRVEAFSVGFGPQIFGFTRGDTEYKVSWIPFGGYVKMAGEEPDDQDGDEPWRFHKKSVPVRSAVILAGPVANIILAIVVYALLYFTYGMPVYSTEIGWVLPDTPAERAGIERGDRITAVAGQPVADFSELAEAIVARKDEALPILVTRGGQTVELSLTLGDANLIGIQPESPPVIGNVVPGGAADRSGMRSGDRIVQIGSESIARWSDLRLALQQDIGEELTVAWERAGVREETALKPDIFEESDADGAMIEVAKLQITPKEEMKRLGFFPALGAGAERTWIMTKSVFAFLKILVTGQASKDMVGGPVQIFQVSSQQAKQGFDKILNLMAFLSVQLGILNLLPIPILDGGHLVFLALEAVRRRPLPANQRMILQQIGLIVILGLMLTVTVFDVGRLLK